MIQRHPRLRECMSVKRNQISMIVAAKHIWFCLRGRNQKTKTQSRTRIDRQNEYNESSPVMNLVMFDQAVEHVCRITRVMDQPRGNALFVGVGGSCKQGLLGRAARG